MNFIKHYISSFSNTFFNEFYREIGDKIIYKEKDNQAIHIIQNKTHDIKWGLIFMAIGFGLFFYLGRHILYKLDFEIFSMLLCVTFSPFALGIYYLVKARSNFSIEFNLKDSNMKINKANPIDFIYLQELNFTHLFGIRNNYSYQLNLNHGLKEITLFTHEDQDLIIETGKYLSEMTGIQLNEIFKEA